MSNEALVKAQTILDELSKKGFNFGNQKVLKDIYESLRLNLKEEYSDGPVGAYFFLGNGIQKYMYVIGHKHGTPVGYKMTNVPIKENKKVMFSFYEDDGMKLAWIDIESDITVENIMLEMKGIIASTIRDVCKCNWNPCTEKWEVL